MKKEKQTTFKVLICDSLADEGMELFRGQKAIETVVKTKLPLEELKAQIKDADACIVRSGTRLTKEAIQAATRLKVIGRAGVGLDNVDVEEASKRGIIVMNTPGGNTISAAEHTLSLLMAIARNIPQADQSLRKGEWERNKFIGVELYKKTLGILGLGRIGTEVAKRAQSFEMRVIAYDPYLRPEKISHLNIEQVSLDDLFKQSDFLTLHMPLTPDTRNIIDERRLKMMKKGVRIVNCARGGLIDEKALAIAIKSGHVAGAGIDVFEEEPPKNSPLIGLPSVVATPHLGASTQEAQVAVSVDVVQSVLDFLMGRGIRNAVNAPCLDPEVLKVLQPYIMLGEKLGAFEAQLIEGHVLQVDINYYGQMLDYETSPITVAIVKGLLAPVLAEDVNYVNASLLAKERGIKITETKSSNGKSFSHLIEVKVKTDKHTVTASGTLFNGKDARIVTVDDLEVEVAPEGTILMILNRDVPGIVGQIGTLLGENKINIAGMTLGRDKLGGQARTFLMIDSMISESVMQKIRQAKNILDAKLIKL